MSIDERVATELRRHAPAVDEQLAWDRIVSAAPVKRRNMAIKLAAVSMAAIGGVALGFILVPTIAGPSPVAVPTSPILGTWVTTDLDESQMTMTVESAEPGIVSMTAYDDYASVCSGAPSTMVGTGSFVSNTELLIPQPLLTCDDGNVPEALSGPPLDEQLRALTFVYHSETDTLTDNFGSVWARDGASVPEPEPATALVWPQSSLDGVEEAQRLADAGDPEYAWQLAPELEESLMSDAEGVSAPEIFARFLREELGWEQFASLPGLGFGGEGTIIMRYVRCAPGQSNPVYPNDPRGADCAPTIGDTHYETVEVGVVQPARQGSSGIWVVTRWEIVESLEQVVPIPESEATTILEAFLTARIAGEGAEQYLDGGDGTAPLLYTTSAGAPYERYELELISGPEWPNDPMRFAVLLYAVDGQTVVESSFTVERDAAGDWGVAVAAETIENGQARDARFYDILGGEVTFSVAKEWYELFGPSFEVDGEWADVTLYTSLGELWGSLRVLADPGTQVDGCHEGPLAASTDELAQNIMSLSDFEATAPLAVTIGGAPGLQMDLVQVGQSTGCDGSPRLAVTSGMLDEGRRMRLYLVDVPGGSARILSIAIVAESSQFDSVVDAAAPIIESFEFHTG